MLKIIIFLLLIVLVCSSLVSYLDMKEQIYQAREFCESLNKTYEYNNNRHYCDGELLGHYKSIKGKVWGFVKDFDFKNLNITFNITK